MLERQFEAEIVVSSPCPRGCGPAAPSLRRSAVPPLCLVRFVQVVVAELFAVPMEDLRAQSRGKAPVALARQVAMYVCHVSLRLDYGRVARAFGRDRTTATHACKIVEERRDDPDLDRVLEFLDRLFREFREERGCAGCKRF